MKRNYVLAVVRAVIMTLWVLSMPIIFLLLRTLRVPQHTSLPHVFHAGMRRLLGIRVHFEGQATEAAPALYVSNHISYLDIIVLGDLRAFFIAKSEVASWPVFGTLAQFQNTLFVERRAGHARRQIEQMQAHLNKGERLTLFAEGTSTNGQEVKPFKSSLFAAADLGDSERKVTIQPITVAYTHHAGKLMNQSERDFYAWYATMPFGSHFLNLFPLTSVDVTVKFHPVCFLEEFDSRKACADHCFAQVEQGLVDLVPDAVHAGSVNSDVTHTDA